jgi:hypothetical protein
MTSSLRDRAANAGSVSPANNQPQQAAQPAQVVPAQPHPAVPLEDIDYSQNPIQDAQGVPVHVAFSRVMADVQSVHKKDQRSDVGGRYNFRGVDRVVNAVGPALRRHGVLMLPTKIASVEFNESKTSKGNTMQEVVMTVQWTVIGPMGDMLPVFESIGQATDTQDKGASKAASVAQRVAMLTALHIPTEDPEVDKGHERGERPVPKAADYVREVAHPNTSASRLRQIHKELGTHGLLAVPVQNELGAEETIGAMVVRIGAERAKGDGQVST